MPGTSRRPQKKNSSVSLRKKTAPRHASANLLIKGGLVVTMDAEQRVLPTDILIRAGRIESIQPNISANGVRIIEAGNWVVLPGLVQAHTRLVQTLWRGHNPGLDALTLQREHLWPYESVLQESDVRAAVRLGIAELLLGGTTSILDLGPVHFTQVLFEEAATLGIRFTCGKTCLDAAHGVPAALRQSWADAVFESEKLIATWHQHTNPRLRYACCLDGMLSASVQAYEHFALLAKQHGTLLHTIVGESAEMAALTRERLGKGEIEALHALGWTGPNVVFAHANWLSTEERRLLKTSGTRVVHCPTADLRLSNGLTRLPEFLADHVMVGLGSGSAAYNDQLDTWQEMRLADLLHQARSGTQIVSAQKALAMATCEGAQVLGLTDVGRIQEGYRADLILLDLQTAATWPATGDIALRLVMAAGREHVHTVIVDGQVVVENKKLLTGYLPRILTAAQHQAERIMAALV